MWNLKNKGERREEGKGMKGKRKWRNVVDGEDMKEIITLSISTFIPPVWTYEFNTTLWYAVNMLCFVSMSQNLSFRSTKNVYVLCLQASDKAKRPSPSRMFQPPLEENRVNLSTSHTYPVSSQLQEDRHFNGADSRLVLLSAPIGWSYWQLCSCFMERVWLVRYQVN